MSKRKTPLSKLFLEAKEESEKQKMFDDYAGYDLPDNHEIPERGTGNKLPKIKKYKNKALENLSPKDLKLFKFSNSKELNNFIGTPKTVDCGRLGLTKLTDKIENDLEKKKR